MKKYLKTILVILILSPMLFLSCSLLHEETPVTGKGKVVVHITDAPFPANLVEHVFVTIERVQLRLKDGNCKTTEGEEIPDCDEGFMLLMDEPVEIDLLQLRNGLSQLLTDAEVPVGVYDMIRLIVQDAEIIIDSEISFPLKVPGGSTGGLKVFLSNPIVVTEDGLSEILIDFDLSRSFIALGNAKTKKGIHGFIFKPVIRAVDIAQSGSIKGKVLNGTNVPLENALVSLYQNSEVITTALTDAEGKFKIIGIPSGTYSLSVEKEGFESVEVKNIVVTKKQEVVKNIKLVQK
jgi:hypothetical protein